MYFFFFQAEDGIRDKLVTGVQTCALPISARVPRAGGAARDQHDRLEGERRGDHAGSHRNEGGAGEVPGATREPGVRPRVVVLSAPSGGGKTTIAKRLLELRPDKFGYSVSATTRAPRAGERHGEAYYFLTRQEFGAWQAEHRVVETASYAAELYGQLH